MDHFSMIAIYPNWLTFRLANSTGQDGEYKYGIYPPIDPTEIGANHESKMYTTPILIDIKPVVKSLSIIREHVIFCCLPSITPSIYAKNWW